MKKILLILVVFSVSQGFAQSPLWQKITENDIRTLDKFERVSVPVKFQLFSLNLGQLKTQLQQAPLDSSGQASSLVLNFPSPDGSLSPYRIYEAPVMEQGLADKFPGLKSYSGRSLRNPAESIRFSITLFGFHLMSLSGESGTFYIDTYTKDLGNYIVYAKKDLTGGNPFQCHVADTEARLMPEIEGDFQRASDGLFRTYRMAMACTIEYAAFHVNAAGLSAGTLAQKKAAVLSAMTVTMTRVNGVFEKDMSLRMNLIANNDAIIFITSDSFDNSNASTLINQSQTVIDATVTAAAYDIGHTVSTGGGGLAQLFSPCSANKARGITGSGAPVGDPFDIDYVAHEIGHQWGANHTQNNACNRNAGTAVEPGSASTIMGYAGICAPNVQSNSDAYFHTVSINEMVNFLGIGGSSCAVSTANGNAAPVVSAGLDFTIPNGTPFVLKGTATDANGDTMTYCWEQTNTEVSTQPPTQTATSGPNFRSLSPSASPNRYMPPLANVVAGNLAPTWEVLPTVARTMNFAFTVRDNRTPNGGQTKRDDMVVTVANVGPFLVTSPNTAVSYVGNTSQTVTWDVAGTTGNGINCANVDILLSTNGGLTFTTTLLANTPNDGTQSVVIPNTPGTTNRIMIMGSNHIFYDVSNTNFTITNGVADTTNPTAATLTASGTTFNSTNLSWSGATDNVGIQNYDVYQGAIVIGTTASTSFPVTGLAPSTAYTFRVRTRDFAGNLSPFSNTVNVTTTAGDTTPPTAPVLIALGTTSASTQLSWSGATDNVAVVSYNVYLGAALLGNTATSPVTINGLTPGTTYTFTVRALDAAGNISVNSNAVTITTPLANYCASTGNSVADELIGNVQLGSINNSSTGGTGYTDFTYISTNLALGSSNTIIITPTWTGTVYPEAYAVFIDYNRDGDFADSGETVFTQAATTATPISGTIVVPTNVAFIGQTRMRVTMKYNALPTACETFDFGQVEDYTVNIVAGSSTVVNAKLMLEGFYDTGTHAMRPVRANQGVGSSTTDVDNVFVELRNASTLALTASTSAMLQTNGSVTATFSSAITGSHYLVIRHRNSVETWSAAPLTISASTPLYDFSNVASKAYGSNMVLLETGVWGIYSGDINQDDSIDASDIVDVTNDAESSAFGDLVTDLNGDGSVDNSDLPVISNNSDNSIFSVQP